MHGGAAQHGGRAASRCGRASAQQPLVAQAARPFKRNSGVREVAAAPPLQRAPQPQSPLLERVLFPLIEEVCLGGAEVDNLGAAVALRGVRQVGWGACERQAV